MGTECIDLKKLNSPRYKTYRLMQSTGYWLKFYQGQINLYKNFNALIFPEMYLGFSENTQLYWASVVKNDSGKSFSISVSKGRVPKIATLESRILIKTSEIIEYENENNTEETAKNLIFFYDTRDFYNTRFIHSVPMFTNKKEIQRYTESIIKEGFNSL